jgi:RHS repeat-associated protein
MFDRGFTGHEHLPQFGLINMNSLPRQHDEGRVYDPFLARFLSPDPFVQAPDYSQNYNRYSYAFNNPLKYTDPDGEWVHLVVGAIIGGVVNWAVNGAEFNAKGLGYFGFGALAGALGAGVGAGLGAALAGNAVAGGGFVAGFMGTATISSTGFVAGAISGAGAGFSNGIVSGTGNQLIKGKKFGEALVKGGLDQAWRQAIGGAAFGAIMGTIDASINKDDWFTGSPYKRYQYSDGNETFSYGGIKTGKGTPLPDTDAPYGKVIEAPRGWSLPSEVTDGYTCVSSKGYDFHPVLTRTGTGAIKIDFPLGTPGGGAIGIKVEAPLRVLNSSNRLFRYDYFFPNERSVSPLFWFVKYLKLN